MSLPIPDLDDKRFSQLVEEARKLIPGYSSEWTDHNLSDLGITLIDLFAWLSEIALYRTNLVTENHRLKYLQLLGVKPQLSKQSRVDLTFTSDEEKTFSKGRKVWTKINDKKIYFQLEEDITILPQLKIDKENTLKILEKIVVNELTLGVFDRSYSNLDEKGDLFFAPFGNEIQKGCAMYLGFIFLENKVPNNLDLMCYLYEKDLIEIKKYDIELDYKVENIGLKWEIWVKKENKGEWNPVLLEDETQGFRKSGKIVFKNLNGWTASQIIPDLGYDVSDSKKTYFWLRCMVEDAFYEYPPRIENLRLNTVSAVHGLMVNDDNLELISNGLPGQVIELRETPVVDNTLKLSIEEERWVEVHNFEQSGPSDKHFVLDKQKGEIKFGNGKKGIIPPRDSNITIMEYSIANCEEFISKGLPDQLFELKGIPPNSGATFKLKVDKDEWIEVDSFDGSGPSDRHFILDRENRKIKFGNGKNGIIPPKDSTIKIKKLSIIGYEEWISKGLPDQLFELEKISLTPEVTFKLIVEKDKWIEVDDFEGSKRSDKHYILNKEKGKIKFGDGMMGFVPSQGSIIRVLEYMTGGGEEGNLMPERSWEIDGFSGSITNYFASTGGKEAQTIEETIEDFCRDLKTPYTAVTLQDFEQLAMSTPGLRIARAKAIPNYDPKTDSEDSEESRGSVTVVIIPYTPLEVLKIPPEPSEDFKKAVCAQLDKHRVLGTDIHVISPIYVKVIVNATVVPVDSYRDDSLIRKKVIEKLGQFIHPITGGMNENGWPIGRDVYLSDLYNIIENIECVNCVLRLSISGDQNESSDANGNLILKSRIASIYSGIHNVEIFREANQCFKRGDSYSGK
ncbi:baseplate J/gp47 family protein [Methanosarcina sp. UBA5]|uniref:baseplate J/gp47 family protein n=1 Tax=Methanosarcina sp. UBA5 TaxID=1915593 RepID=UPI0025F4BE02|nr:baseplate J/gp47 family protein [Methanosarcina sp. UBA5]